MKNTTFSKKTQRIIQNIVFGSQMPALRSDSYKTHFRRDWKACLFTIQSYHY